MRNHTETVAVKITNLNVGAFSGGNYFRERNRPLSPSKKLRTLKAVILWALAELTKEVNVTRTVTYTIFCLFLQEQSAAHCVDVDGAGAIDGDGRHWVDVVAGAAASPTHTQSRSISDKS